MADIKSEVFNALTADAALAAIVGENIFYNVIDDTPQNLPAVLVVVRSARTEREMTGEIIRRVYEVNIKCISTSQAKVYEIVEAVEAVTNSIGGENETDDEPIFEPEWNTFTMNIDFEAS